MTNDEIMQAAADQLAKDMLDMLSPAVAMPFEFYPDDMAAFRVIDRLDWRLWSYTLIGSPPLPMCIITGI
jgi:hypothetical protein